MAAFRSAIILSISSPLCFDNTPSVNSTRQVKIGCIHSIEL